MMWVESIIILIFFMALYWFVSYEPISKHIPIVPEPWESQSSSYNRVSEDLDAWQRATFGEEE